MAMYFKCKTCGSEHYSKIQMPKATFESPTTVIVKSLVPCPTTGQIVRVDKPDIFWKDTARASA